MPRLQDAIRVIGLVAAMVASAFVSLHPVYQVLLVLMASDIVTGAMRAYQQRVLTSRVAIVGVTRKAGELILVALCAYLQLVVPEVAALPLPEAVAMFYVYNEGLSVIENLAAIGVPIPDFLTRALSELAPEKGIKAGGASSGPVERVG